MKNLTTLSLITATILGLTGCGGSSSTPSNTNTSPTGHVGDGYIQGAYVCHDSNNNLDCLDETYTTTASDGSFTLSNYDASQDLLVQIPAGAVDNGPFVNGSTTPRPFTNQTWYYYPAQAAPANGPIFVGPLSTLVYAQTVATPGVSVATATDIVGTTLGINTANVLLNYLESNSSDANQSNFVAELVGSSISYNTSSTTTTAGYSNTMGGILSTAGNIGTTASSNDSTTYDTTTYGSSNTIPNGTNTVTPIIYTATNDVCSAMLTCDYFAFEEWDTTAQFNSNFPSTPDQEHKTLCMHTDADTGENILNIKEELYQSNAWSIETQNTSTELNYLNDTRETIIDMVNVNNSNTQNTSPLRLFPAKNIACNGTDATFKAGLLEYKLIVSETDITGMSGANLPQGDSLSPLIDNITFATGDKLFKTLAVLQNTIYVVDNSYNFVNGTSNAPVSQYTVYEEGSIGGVAFTPMSNNQNIYSLAQLTDTDFIVEYTDSNNFTKLEVASSVSSANNGTVTVTKISSGIVSSPNTMTYEIETHNTHKFFIVKNFNGLGEDLFLGRVNSIDSNNFIFGGVSHVNSSFYFTQGGYQDGDIMDDIMLNTSARDRVLAAQSITAP